MCRLVFYQFIYLAPHVVYQCLGILPPASSSKPQSPTAFPHLTPALGSCLRLPHACARLPPSLTSSLDRKHEGARNSAHYNLSFRRRPPLRRIYLRVRCESAFIAHLNALCCDFCACGRYLLFGFAQACLHIACRMSSPSRMLLAAVLRLSRKTLIPPTKTSM